MKEKNGKGEGKLVIWVGLDALKNYGNYFCQKLTTGNLEVNK